MGSIADHIAALVPGNASMNDKLIAFFADPSAFVTGGGGGPAEPVMRDILIPYQGSGSQFGVPAGEENVDIDLAEAVVDGTGATVYTFIEYDDTPGAWNYIDGSVTRSFTAGAHVLRIGYADSVANPAAEEPDAGTIFSATIDVQDDVPFHALAVLAADTGPVRQVEKTLIDTSIMQYYGDLIVGDGAGYATRLGLDGLDDVYLHASGNVLEWVPFPGSALPVANGSVKAYRTSPVAVPTATVTPVPFNADEIDTLSLHDEAGNSSHVITVPEGFAGIWEFNATASWAANATGRRELFFRKNGVDILKGSNSVNNAGAVDGTYMMGPPTTVYLVEGDYVELCAYQNSGGNLNLNANDTTCTAKFVGVV